MLDPILTMSSATLRITHESDSRSTWSVVLYERADNMKTKTVGWAVSAIMGLSLPGASLLLAGATADATEAAIVAAPGVAPGGDLSDAMYIDMDGQRLGTAADLGLATDVSAAALGCTPVSGRDNPHRSSTGVAVSGHGWWDKGTCNNNRADVLNCLYEWYTDRSWRMKTCSPVKELAPGGGSSNRTVARLNCNTTHLTSWRNHVNVDVKWEVDTNEIPYRQADVQCRVP